MADAIEIFTNSSSERIEVITAGAQGPKGDAGGATFDQDLNTTDAVTFASVNAPLYDAALSQDGASIDDGVLNIHGASGTAKLDTSDLTGTRSHYLPDESGHLALTENTATAAQGALADTAVQPNTDPMFSSVAATDGGIGSSENRTTLGPTSLVFKAAGTSHQTSFVAASATDTRTLTLPNATGTLALTSQIPTTFAASAISDSTTAGRALLTAADASAQRTSLGLGTAALSASTDFAASTHTHAASAITSGTLDNARINWAAPSAIGGTTPAAGAFTSLTAAPAANTSAFAASGYSLTGSNAQSLIDLAGTWNTTGTPTAFKLNVTDTASAAASLFLDLQIGGSPKAQFTKLGSMLVYNTYTSATNYERGFFKWSSNVLQIGTEKGSGGGTARALEFLIDGVARGGFDASGNFNANILLGANKAITFGNGFTMLDAPATAGVLRVYPFSGSSVRIQLGGNTASYPAIYNSGTTIQAVLANNTSTFTAIQGKLTTDTNAAAGTITPDKTLTLYDAAGTAYKVPCVAA